MVKKSVKLVFAALILITSTAAAQPTAANFGVNDASGNPNTFVLVPVDITNVQNGSVAGIGFSIAFDPNVLSLTAAGVSRGDLTTLWDSPGYNPISGQIYIVTAAANAIPNGSTGSVAVLNFSVVGASGATSVINISRIQLSDINGNVGTAPAKSGIFTVTGVPQPGAKVNGKIAGTITNASSGTGISGATVTAVGISTATNSSGGYSISIAPGIYNVAVNAAGYVSSSTSNVAVISNVPTIVNLTLTPVSPSSTSNTVTRTVTANASTQTSYSSTTVAPSYPASAASATPVPSVETPSPTKTYEAVSTLKTLYPEQQETSWLLIGIIGALVLLGIIVIVRSRLRAKK